MVTATKQNDKRRHSPGYFTISNVLVHNSWRPQNDTPLKFFRKPLPASIRASYRHLRINKHTTRIAKTIFKCNISTTQLHVFGISKFIKKKKIKIVQTSFLCHFLGRFDFKNLFRGFFRYVYSLPQSNRNFKPQ